MASKVTEADVLDKLTAVQDPDLRRDIVSLGFVKNVKICAPAVSFDIELTTPACPVKDRLRAEAENAVKTLPGIDIVTVNMTSNVRAAPTRAGAVLSEVKNIIAVASGKGGVGKSTAAANLAVALRVMGARVGLCDADVYGPSMPTMFGIEGRPQADGQERLIPLEAHGVKLMSMGFLTTRETPVIWRGPMATKLIQQFLGGVAWGGLDYLVIDLPPGTGDVQLTLTQSVPLTGAVIITTPQDVARSIAEKGLRMFQQVQVPILGIIENMSTFVCPHCGETTHIFKKGGGERSAGDLGLPFLGAIPIDPEVAEGGDDGVPIVVKNPRSPAAEAFFKIAQSVAAQISIVNFETSSGAAPREIVEDDKALRFKWADGSDSVLSFELLRNHCPCAVCVDEWSGKRKFLTLLLPSNFRPVSISPVGRYAVQISWSDGHSSGIYSFRLVRELTEQAATAPH